MLSLEKALLLNSKNRVKWAIISLLGFQYLLNLIHLWSMCLLILIGYLPHGHTNSSLGKNLSQYSLIGAWLMMAFVALAHNEFEWPKYFSHDPSFIYIGSILLRSSSKRSFFDWIPIKTCMETVGSNWTSWFLYLQPCEATNYLYLGNPKIWENYDHFFWRIAWSP